MSEPPAPARGTTEPASRGPHVVPARRRRAPRGLVVAAVVACLAGLGAGAAIDDARLDARSDAPPDAPPDARSDAPPDARAAGSGTASTATSTATPTATSTAAPGPARTAVPTPAAPRGAATPRSSAAARGPWGDPRTARVDDASSLLVVVNKARPLEPADYAPRDLVRVQGVELRRDAAAAFTRLTRAAADAGHPLVGHSAYRSFAQQRVTYEGWVAELGRARADVQSARPGYSEHQTGLAVDVVAGGGACGTLACFGRTPQARWVAANAYRFGFVVRYLPGEEKVTGYTSEPWHLRYVGRPTAQGMRAHGVRSLEAYFGLPAAGGARG